MNHAVTLLAVLLCFASQAEALAASCDEAALRAAEVHGVPPQIMLAIARVESGTARGGTVLPWPWAVNQAGDPHWFDTAAEAEAFVQAAIEDGARNIDIGCFQLNLRWHAKNFSSLTQMFDPAENADYAARFLVENHQRKGNWVDAVAIYHSSSPDHAAAYIGKVERVLADLAPQRPATGGQATKRANTFPLLQKGMAGGHGSLVPQRNGALPLLISTP